MPVATGRLQASTVGVPRRIPRPPSRPTADPGSSGMSANHASPGGDRRAHVACSVATSGSVSVRTARSMSGKRTHDPAPVIHLACTAQNSSVVNSLQRSSRYASASGRASIALPGCLSGHLCARTSIDSLIARAGPDHGTCVFARLAPRHGDPAGGLACRHGARQVALRFSTGVRVVATDRVRGALVPDH